MKASKVAIAVAGAGLMAGLLMAVLPTSYVASGGGPQKDTAYPVSEQRVDCGLALAPKNPTPPLGVSDECDAVHVKQWVRILLVMFSAFAVSGTMLAAIRFRRRSASGNPGAIHPCYVPNESKTGGAESTGVDPAP